MNSSLPTSPKGSLSLFARLRKSGRDPKIMKQWFYGFLILLTGALIHDFGFLGEPVGAAPTTEEQQKETTSHDGKDAKAKGEHTQENNTVEKHSGGGHSDPVAPVLISIAIILLLAKLGGDLAERVNMPAVLGELIVGVMLGNVALVTGYHGLDFFKPVVNESSHEVTKADDANQSDGKKEIAEKHQAEVKSDSHGSGIDTGTILQMLASIGVVLLLFEVGLESSVREMMSVGLSSFLVAILGVVAPMLMGYGITMLILPDAGWMVYSFVGATLCATSVGITARVLKDLGKSQLKESKIILGAAVIDDVMGLIVLAVVSGIISSAAIAEAGGAEQGGSLAWDLTKIILFSVGFLAGALILGALQFPRLIFKSASYLRGHGMLVASSLVICFGFSWLANQAGLAPIVGAFAAGLILESAHYQELGDKENLTLEKALEPISALLVPIFFVQMGLQVDLASLGDSSVWLLAGGITTVAIIGKQVCALGVVDKGLNKMAVGLGMIPRGEVGLIFAAIGKDLSMTSTPVAQGGTPVIGGGTYTAVVVMVMVTTMVTPPLLKWSLSRGDEKKD